MRSNPINRGIYFLGALLGLASAPAQAAFHTVCASGCTYTTISLAVANGAVVSGDTIVLEQNMAEDVTFNNGKNLFFTSDAIPRTWDGANDANPTLTLANGTTANIYNLTMDHSSASGGYVIAQNSNGDPVARFYNATLKRSSTSTTSNAIYRCDNCNNKDSQVSLSRTALIGTANTYGIWVVVANTRNPILMANCTVGGFSNALYPAILIAKTDQAGGQQLTNCTFYNNNTAIKYSYSGANTNANAYTQNCLFFGNSSDVVWNGSTGNAKQFYRFNLFTQLPYDALLGMGNIIGGTATNEVNNATAGSEDLNLKAGAWSINNGNGANASADDISGTAKLGIRDIGAYESTGVNCVGGAVTVYMNVQAMDRLTGTTKNLDLSLAGAASNGMGSPVESNVTDIGYPGSTAGDYVFRPATAYVPTNSAPGAAAKGYGWVSPRVLNNDLAAGTWTFSNRFQGNIANAPVIKHEVAVYAWDPGTGTDTLLFSSISGTNITASITGYAQFTSVFSSVQPSFSGTAGKYLRVEVYANISGSGFAGGTMYMGYNTANDFVAYPGDNCGSPTITPTFSVTPTFSSTASITPTLTASPTSTETPSSTATPSSSSTVTQSSTSTPSPTVTPMMALVKSANVAAANFGDTVTYTFSYFNDSSAAADMSVWDTVPAQISFQGCDNSCSQAGSLVLWSLPSVPAGTGGTVNFWGVISGYPWVPGSQGWESAEAPYLPGWRRGSQSAIQRRT